MILTLQLLNSVIICINYRPQPFLVDLHSFQKFQLRRLHIQSLFKDPIMLNNRGEAGAFEFGERDGIFSLLTATLLKVVVL